MKTLLHVCCAPCSVKCIDIFFEENITPVLFWYNPNIHPFKEYENRKDALISYSCERGTELVLKDEYGLRKFLLNTYPDFNKRCEYCYIERIGETAKYAAANGYKSFSTTLLISPYQNHNLIYKIAKEFAAEYNIEFLYRDFRLYFREGQKIARESCIYMQKYCGCIFSEEERYNKSRKW